jgi:hypothetical protein
METIVAELERSLLRVYSAIELHYPGVSIAHRTRNHLLYILLPVARHLTDVASYQDWIRELCPPSPYREDIGAVVKDTIEQGNFERPEQARLGPVIASVVAYLVLSELSSLCPRGLVSPSSLYRYIERHPFLHRALSRAHNYYPRYRLETKGQSLEESISEELLAGICSYLHLGLSITELHPAHPNGEISLQSKEIVAPYLLDGVRSPFHYCATVAGPDLSTRDVTFDSADFVVGVRTGACWSGADPEKALLNSRESLTQQAVHVTATER